MTTKKIQIIASNKQVVLNLCQFTFSKGVRLTIKNFNLGASDDVTAFVFRFFWIALKAGISPTIAVINPATAVMKVGMNEKKSVLVMIDKPFALLLEIKST